MGPTVNGTGDSQCDTDSAQDPPKPNSNGINDKIEPIAIIGLDLRFPQDASSAKGFWQLLLEGRSAMTEVPPDRYNIKAFYHPDHKHSGTVNVLGGHYLKEDIKLFDAPFFSVSAPEAECMDPQQRFLLETTYRALENAGLPMEKVVGSKTAVYVASFTHEYAGVIGRDPELQAQWVGTGNGSAMLSNRLSYFFDLLGPSITLDTACSGSMNAFHLACNTLRNREATMAGARWGIQHILEPRYFDERANGYARGEGFGVVVLKLLRDALQDNDTIRAVIRASGSNQDGRSLGLTQPSNVSQKAIIRQTYTAGGLELDQTRYFEAHGTGTGVGDPIEANSIGNIFASCRSPDQPLYVGAVKSNIGHLEGCSGVAGLIKTVLVLEHGVIPPNINFEKVNPKIDPEAMNIKFPLQNYPWPTEGLRRASINSFGYGGSNAHVILDDACNYLESRGLKGNHWTAKLPPNQDVIDKYNSLIMRPRKPASESSNEISDEGNPKEYGTREGGCVQAENASTLDSPAVKTPAPGSSGAGSLTNGSIEEPSYTVESNLNGEAPNSIKVNSHSHPPCGGQNDLTTNTEVHLSKDSIGLPTSSGEIEVQQSFLSQQDALSKLFMWSSADEGGPNRFASAFTDHLTKVLCRIENAEEEQAFLRNLAFTLSSRRSLLSYKTYSAASSIAMLIDNLKQGLPKATQSSKDLNLGFVFTGQGAQWYAMGRELLNVPEFNNSIREADKYFWSIGCKWSIFDELERDEISTNINRPEYSQPICTALQVALVELLKGWGVYPSAVVGHSSGEIAAAFAAGALSRESAWLVSYYRGVLSGGSSFHRGRMMAVGLPEDDMRAILEREELLKGPGDIVVACINSPKNVTVSGAEHKINALKEILDEREIFARKLKVDRAYHSPYMKDVSREYAESIKQIGAPQDSMRTSPMFSSVSGEEISFSRLCSPDYWASNMVSPVRFSDAIAAMCEGSSGKPQKLGSRKYQASIDHLLEIGPAGALQTPIRDTLLIRLDKNNFKYFSMLQRGVSATKTSLDTAGSLFCLGYPVKLELVNDTNANSCDMLIDLPAYPFDHSKPYWGETRLSKNFRFRKYPRHDLLGAPNDDWDENDAKWRHFLRTTENPWVVEHRISGAILYPGAGMLVMAIEAAKQLAKPDKIVKGYRIREVAFLSPLVIPFGPVGVETHFHLRPMRDSAIGTSANWFEFRLSSLEGDKWKDKCRGLVTIEYEEDMTAIDQGREAEEELKHFHERHALGEESCTIEVGARDLYEHLSAVGYSYGPIFQLLANGRCSKNYEAVADVNMPDVSKKMPKGHIHEHVIHPVTLDNVFQLSMMAGTKGGKLLGQVLIPTFVRDIYVSTKLTNRRDAIRGYSESKLASFRDVESDILCLDPQNLEPLVVIEGFRVTALTASVMGNNPLAGSGKRKLAFSTDWKPDIALLDNEQAGNLFNSPKKLSEIPTACGSDYYQSAAEQSEIQLEEGPEASPVKRSTMMPETEIEDVEFICYAFMRKHLPKFTDEFVKNLGPHHKTYVAWVKKCVEGFAAGVVTNRRSVWKTLVQNEQYVREVTERLKSSSLEGKLCTRIGPVLPELLSGPTTDLDALLAKGDLLRNAEDSGLGLNIAREKLCAYIDVFAHKDSNLQVLELGAGRGATTSFILQTLTRQGTDHGAPRFAAYTFTDTTDTLFEEAKEKFKEYGQKVQFLPLNMDIDVAGQGFGLEKFDLIIAANPLLAMSNINTYLQNVKKLLKPKGGKFCILEKCNPSALRSTFIFGLQPGWWRNADQYGTSGPIIQKADWASILEKNHFTGIEINLPDFVDGNLHMTSAMISTTVQEKANRPTSRPVPSFVLVTSPASSFQKEIATRLKEKLEVLGSKSCDIIGLEQVSAIDLKKKCTVFLPEIEKPFLRDMDSNSYSIIQRVINTSFGVVWLTHGATMTVSQPAIGMVTGLARSVRTENTPLSFLTVDFEKTDDPMAIAGITLKVVKQAIHSTSKPEVEYAVRNGILYIHRVVEAAHVDNVIATSTGTMPPTPQKLGSFNQEPIRPMVLSIRTPGLIDTLHFVDNPFANIPLNEDEIDIEVRATGLNFLDLMAALGRIPGSLGVECSGTVFRAGEKSGFQVGDRVCGYVVLGFANYTRTKASLAKKVPEIISYAEAASLPVIFATAYHAFYDIARLKCGETVMVHWGAGGVGQAAIQIAQIIGAEIFTTVGSDEKRDFLIEKYGIRRDHIFSSRDMTFARGIRRMTKGRGVDVILNAMAGDELRETWSCIAPYGRFVEISKRDIQVYGRLPMQPFSRQASFSSVDLEFMWQHCPDTLGDILGKVIKLVEERKLHPPQPLHRYKYEEIEDAIRLMQSGMHIGKIVIEAGHDDMVKAAPDSRPTYKFEADATYIIAGGLGGLGRSLARWFASRGAMNLVLLSRRGMANPASESLISELATQGVKLAAIACDICDERKIISTLEELRETLPPIRGLVQSAMVLRDAMFDNMTYEDYTEAVRPKVWGSWNLHKHLPKDLDFFILLSSSTGITGSRPQANYASGNTYEDALAYYRVSNGQKAISLDLGLMLGIGFVAENKDAAANIKFHGCVPIKEAELLAIMDYSCNPSLPLTNRLNTHIAFGLETPSSMRRQGMEESWWMRFAPFTHLSQMGSLEGSHFEDSSAGLEPGLRAAAGVEEAATLIYDALVRKICKTLAVAKEDIDENKPLNSYGVDSLVAMEVRNWFMKEAAADIPVFDILGGASLRQLSFTVAKKSVWVNGGLAEEEQEERNRDEDTARKTDEKVDNFGAARSE